MAKEQPTKKTQREEQKKARKRKQKEVAFEKRASTVAKNRVISMQGMRRLIKAILEEKRMEMFPNDTKHQLRPSDRAVDIIRRVLVSIGTEVWAEAGRTLTLTRLQRVTREMIKKSIDSSPYNSIFQPRLVANLN